MSASEKSSIYLASGIFIGVDSEGYKNGERYDKLIITNLKIRRRDGSGVVKYGSVFAMLRNWQFNTRNPLDAYPQKVQDEVNTILRGDVPKKVAAVDIKKFAGTLKIPPVPMFADYFDSIYGSQKMYDAFVNPVLGKTWEPLRFNDPRMHGAVASDILNNVLKLDFEDIFRFPWSVGFHVSQEQLDKDIAYLKEKLAEQTKKVYVKPELKKLELTAVFTEHGTFKVGEEVKHYLGGGPGTITSLTPTHANVTTSDVSSASWQISSLRKIVKEVQNEHGTFKVGDTVAHATVKDCEGVILKFHEAISIPWADIKISEAETVRWNVENLRKPKPKKYRMLTVEEATKAGRDYADRQEYFAIYQHEAKKIAEGYSETDKMVHTYYAGSSSYPSSRKIYKADLTCEPIPQNVPHFGVAKPKFEKGDRVKVLCNRANATIIQYETAKSCSVKFDGMAGTFVFMEEELGKILAPTPISEYQRLIQFLNSDDVKLLFDATHIDWAAKNLLRFKDKLKE